MICDSISVTSEAITAIFTALAVAVAWWQLGGIKRGLDMSSLMAILEIETQINDRKVELDKRSADVRQAELDKLHEEAIKIRDDLYHSAKENYFNALDRLCACILRGYFPEDRWRADYRNSISNVVKTHPDDFNEASEYRNIKALNKKWQSDS